VQQLAEKIKAVQPAKMLHAGIANNFMRKRSVALSQAGVKLVSQQIEVNEGAAQPTIATVSAEEFLKNPLLHQEIFGPYSLLVICADATQMLEVAKSLEGQLTATLMATANELQENEELVDAVKDLCGRIIINGVPTGVEVALAMHHGGPYPATTDSRFTAVGADALKRFARPVCFQNWCGELLPDELKDANPLGLWRTVNNELTR
jgi:2,5-dioxopentanoate dehydrogenase